MRTSRRTHGEAASQAVASAARWLGGLLAPCLCLGCEALVPAAAYRLGLCHPCRERLRAARRPWCAGCGLPLFLPAAPRDALCGRCRRRPPPYARLVYGWAYEPPLSQLVRACKFRRLEYLAEDLGRALAGRLAGELAGARLVVPVPLHWWRRLGRGFNQAEVIARALAAELGLPCRNVLTRRYRPPHATLARRARLRGASGLFRLVAALPEDATTVLLVDDVVTTGATLRSAAATLAAGGERQVVAVALARTPELAAEAPQRRFMVTGAGNTEGRPRGRPPDRST